MPDDSCATHPEGPTLRSLLEEASALPPEAQAALLAHARLLAAGPVDRDALGREALLARGATRPEWIRESWAIHSDREKEMWRRVGEHLYRLGQASVAARHRELVEAVDTYVDTKGGWARDCALKRVVEAWSWLRGSVKGR